MDAVKDPETEKIVLMTSSQVGKTEIENNIIGYYIHLDPCPIMMVHPTVADAENWSKTRFAPMLRDSACFEGLIQDARSRDANNTLLAKSFPGGHITLVGANAPSGLAARPIRILLFDEVNRFPVSAGDEGDPVSLAVVRTTTFQYNRKIILASTPTSVNGRIERAFEESDKRFYYIPCPHCGEYQRLKWGGPDVHFGVKWPKGKPLEAHYVCEKNGCVIADIERFPALAKGEWQASAEFTGTAGFHLNVLYNPWMPLSKVAADFLEKKKAPETLRTWVNTSLGEPFEDETQKIESKSLYSRRKDWGRKAPPSVLVVTAGVDVQDDRLEMELVGWGIGEENWSLDYKILYGSTAETAVWAEMEKALMATVQRADGVELPIACTGIDTGGHRSQEVYEFCTRLALHRVMALKGSNQAGKPIVGRPSKAGRTNVHLWPVGTDTAKEWIMSRLQLLEEGPGYCHFPAAREEEWFRQITAEHRVTRIRGGVTVMRWETISSGRRNEALDCRVYALAALKILNPDLEQLAETPPPAPPKRREEEKQSAWVPTRNDWLER